MIRKSLVIGLILSCPLFAQIQWTGPRPISSGVTPDMAVDPTDGKLHIIALARYVTPPGIVYSKIDPSKLDTENYQMIQETIPNTDSEIGLLDVVYMGPSIAVDQSGNPHICYRTPGSSQYYNNIVYRYRTASGWSNPLTIRSNVSRGYAVQMAIDKNNVVHLVHGEASVGDLADGTFSYYQIKGNAIIKSQISIDKYHGNDRLAIDVDKDGGVHVLVAPQYPPYEGPIYYYSKGGTNNLARVGDIHSMSASGRNGAPDVFADLNNTIHFAYGTQTDSEISGKGSVRYGQYKNGTSVLDKVVTPASGTGVLESWKDGNGWGLGGVAATSEGEVVVIAYLTKDNGPLYSVYSMDGGKTWSTPELRTPYAWGLTDGRALHVIRAYQNNIYLVYPTPNNTLRIQYIRNIGDELPIASAGGPYESPEGSAMTFNATASIDTGMNAGITKYEWDWQNDGSYDIFTTQPTIPHTYFDDFLGQVRLRITDLSGNQAIATASVLVSNVPPTVTAGPDWTIDEGQSVAISATVTDPGQETPTLTWQFSDGGSSSGTDTIQRSYPDNGNFSIIVTAQDDDGGVGRDTVNIVVVNVPPVANAGGPYNGSRNLPIEFFGTATDVGTLDIPTYSWDMDNDGVFETPGNRTTQNWATAGVYTIWFKAVDDDGGVGLDSALVTITADKPTILAIPDQVIQEGGSFPPLNLDQYVIHPFQTPEVMAWTVADTVQFSAVITDRQLAVSVPNSDWFGQERLTLTVQDLGGFKDTSTVTYRVVNVNDPPVWHQKAPDYAFDEDKSLSVSFAALRPRVSDIDNAASDFTFSVQASGVIQATIDTVTGVILFSAPHDWNGSENVLITVSDGAGRTATDTSHIIVNPMPDAPLPFMIVSPTYLKFDAWPDTIVFDWHRPADPDGEVVSNFIWTLEPIEVAGNPPAMEKIVKDTTFEFYPDPAVLLDGVWRWSVTAKDNDGLTTPCEVPGHLIKNATSGVAESVALPTELALHQNYPNPFNPETTIHYDLPKETWIDLTVFNSLGQKIRSLESGLKQAGTYQVRWNGEDDTGNSAPSGIYIYRLKTESQVLYKKMMLVH